jgi:hypothetical protein
MFATMIPKNPHGKEFPIQNKTNLHPHALGTKMENPQGQGISYNPGRNALKGTSSNLQSHSRICDLTIKRHFVLCLYSHIK